MFIDARVTIHQRPYRHTDCNAVHSAMRPATFYQQIPLGGNTFQALPGMYRSYGPFANLADAEERIKRILEPLGFEISLQIMQVSEERVCNLKPASSGFLSALFETPATTPTNPFGWLSSTPAPPTDFAKYYAEGF